MPKPMCNLSQGVKAEGIPELTREIATILKLEGYEEAAE